MKQYVYGCGSKKIQPSSQITKINEHSLGITNDCQTLSTAAKWFAPG
jgi:hypothetical protein